ncbi:hypothetical protein K7432_003089 [Basidiobolus ranarum]|uniref:Secreted protein n=1 Tax=Basidiobolus ranarum TaxID=34480 RepID=A0ABR2X0J8_9FUNG
MPILLVKLGGRAAVAVLAGLLKVAEKDDSTIEVVIFGVVEEVSIIGVGPAESVEIAVPIAIDEEFVGEEDEISFSGDS